MKKETILFIGQEDQNTSRLRELLTENEYHAITEPDPAEAMSCIGNQEVHYVVLDKQTAEAVLGGKKRSREEKIKDAKGHLVIDLKRRMVKKNGEEIHLTPTEYNLLATMAKSPQRIFSRAELITYALGDEFHGYDRSIDTYIKSLREKIEEDRKKPRYICTVHGMGYKFIP